MYGVTRKGPLRWPNSPSWAYENETLPSYLLVPGEYDLCYARQRNEIKAG